MLGTAQYPSPAILAEAVRASGAGVVTVSLRREAGGEPGRAGLLGADPRARRARAAEHGRLPHGQGGGDDGADGARGLRHRWIKLEVIGEDDTLQPDVFGAGRGGAHPEREGFEVFPYTTEDLVVAERLLDAGCKVLMPWGAPIGSGLGLNNPYGAAHACARISRTCRWSSMPASACRRHAARGDGDRLSTRCCSTPPSPRRATRPRWPRAFAAAVEAGRAGLRGRPDGAARHGGALDAGHRQGVPAT